jgi:hypothetical protein
MRLSGVSRRELGMKQRNTIVIGVMLGACTTGIYSWYTRPGTSGEALANTPLPAVGKASGAFESLAPTPPAQAPAASSPPAEPPSVTTDPSAETPGVAANPPVETAPTPPAERVIAPPGPPGSPIRNSGRGRSKRDD